MSTVAQCRDLRRRYWPCLYSNLTKDLISVVSLGVVVICIRDFAQPFHRGLQCDDETIRYPYSDSTVSTEVCYSVGSAINVALILILEYLNLANDDGTNDPTSPSRSWLKIYLCNVYCRMIVWLFGAITSELITDLTKVTADISLDEYCLGTRKPFEYITDYYCSGPKMNQRDARLSFVSGHSSYSAYSAIFAITYIQSALDIRKLGLIKPAFQVLIISAAFYTGLTRVSDYKHHWQDVLAGLTLGTAIAAFANAFLWPPFYRVYSKLLNTPSSQPDHDQSGAELNRFSY